MQPRRNVVESFRSEANAEAVVDAEKKPTGFRGVAYSGRPVRRFFGMMAVDLAGMEIKTRVPITLNHNDGELVGHATIVNSGEELRVEDGVFLKSTPAGRMVAETMAEGQPWEYSIGTSGEFFSADRKKPVELNGRKLEVDGYIGRARLLHVSFCPSGADSSALASQLSARYGLPTVDGANMSSDNTQSNDANELATLRAENERLRAASAASEAAAKTARDAARKQRIDAAFGADLEEAERVAYMEMSDTAYDVVEKRFKAALSGVDPSLTRRESKSGDTSGNPTTKFAAIDDVKPDMSRAGDYDRIVAHMTAHKVSFTDAALALGL